MTIENHLVTIIKICDYRFFLSQPLNQIVTLNKHLIIITHYTMTKNLSSVLDFDKIRDYRIYLINNKLFNHDYKLRNIHDMLIGCD